jgi:hypothetical protein
MTAEAAATLDFSSPSGGDVTRALTVPFLAGMDAIVVTAAAIQLRAAAKLIEVDYQAVNADGGGVIVSLAAPQRLRKIQIQYTSSPSATTLRTVVRAVSGAPSSFQIGPPIFAAPPFAAPGPMFGPVLGGMTVQQAAGGTYVLSVPAQLGAAWLIQLATGDDATQLSPLAVTPVVQRVWIDGLPQNLSLVLDAAGGAVPLWSHPNLLLPESGDQPVSFLPIAQKILSQKLAAPGAGALALPLKFHSDSACRIELSTESLAGEYSVRPFAVEPLAVRTGGGWDPVRLSAPAGLRPLRATTDVTVKLLGRSLNAASPSPPIFDSPGSGPGLRPSSGLRVDPRHSVAAACGLAPLDGAATGSALSIASVRIFATAGADAEVVLELRNDASGLPGQTLAPPIPMRIAAAPPDWLEFVLPKPLAARAGGAPLWIALRATRGELLWFAGAPGGGVRVSPDSGATWAPPRAAGLAPAAGMWAQLFHLQPDPQPAPVVALRQGATTLSPNLVAGGTWLGPREYRVPAATLPILDRLAASAGTGRVETLVYVSSRAAAVLTFSNGSLAYDPFAGGND